jgi:glycosyltransferase involved in cell wall biosynthesis|tara:strand:+ start:233 stop:1396 length:1164 start_codon:yes stop_codon:yes gene_type:complete
MKIFYWSPFISKVATVSSVIKSAESITRYSKKNNVNVAIIDAVGEWTNYKKLIDPKIEIINLNKKNIFRYLPKGNFFKSRLSYVLIFVLNFFKLLNLIKNKRPDYLIAHLLTSLPIFLTLFFNNKTKIVLRISGLPKLNFFRFIFWKLFSKNIYSVTCPTTTTYKYLKKMNIFNKNNIVILRDPVIKINEFLKKKYERVEDIKIEKKNLIIGIGRFTRQKNFLLLIKAFKKILIKYPNYHLILLGEGEQEEMLKEKVKKLEIQNKVFFLGYQKNVYKYLLNSDCFILTSLWEDPGFVILEAALSNTLIISSNCPNGPDEILSSGRNGFLFKNNDISDLLNKFDKFKNSTEDELKKKRFSVKKQLKMFTQFAHFKSLEKIIELNDKKN